jgi:hypothetical protein
MFKNIEILDTKKFKNLKFDDITPIEVGKNIGMIPLGFHEIVDMSFEAPILIIGTDTNMEFVAFSGINKEITIFNKEVSYAPMFLKTYPFLNVMAKDEKEQLNSVIGIDNSDKVGAKKKFFILTKKNELDKIASEKVAIVRELNRQRDISKKIIGEFKKYDLLVEKDFKVQFKGEEKTILEKFYIVNREKLVTLPDAVIALWAKKGWMTLIDMHIKSLANFQKVLTSTK